MPSQKTAVSSVRSQAGHHRHEASLRVYTRADLLCALTACLAGHHMHMKRQTDPLEVVENILVPL